MKRIGIVFALIIIFIWAVPSFAANVVQQGKDFIYVKLDGTNDFDWSTATFTTGKNAGLAVSTVFPEGLALSAVINSPPSAGAVLVIREGSLTGAIMPPRFRAIAGDSMVFYYDTSVFYKPCIEHDDQTTDTNNEVWFKYINK
jgi:hypothetical protein